MITSSNENYERQRTFEIAVLASIALHFLLGLLFIQNWALFKKLMDRAPKEEVATVETIKLERRIQPPPRAPKPRVVQPQAPVHTDPMMPTLPVPKALQEPPRPQTHQRSEVSHLVVHAPPQSHQVAGSRVPGEHYDEAQLAALQNEFKQSIAQAQSRADAQQSASTSGALAPAVAPKHYAMSFSGIHDNLRHGEGTIDGCTNTPHGKYNYHYYCHYEYMYADGHVEQDTIPWPQIYPSSNDPLMASHSRVNILPPPADYKPDRPLQPLLQFFFGGPKPAP